MKYNGIDFEAIMATPACGKSYLCDKYPDLFVDADELRLKLKYKVPEQLTRDQLESTKGEKSFQRQYHGNELDKKIFEQLDKCREEGKTIIASPHIIFQDYFVSRNIKYCFVYPNKTMQEEIARRMVIRGNPESTVKENYENFYEFYASDTKESSSALHYEFGQDEFLEDILKKFGFDFSKKPLS